MTLNGVVDAPLNGGIPLYRSAFLISDYASNHPEDEDKINQLQSAVDAQVIVIIELLGLHGRICPASMLPFHESLLNCRSACFLDHQSDSLVLTTVYLFSAVFAKNFAPELDRLTLPLSSSRSLAFPPISRINSPPSAPVLSPKLTPTSNPQPLPPLTNTQTNGSTSALARLTSPFGSFNNASASNSRFQPHGGSSSHNSAHARPNSHASGGGGGRAPRPSLGSMFSSGSGGRSDQQQRSESPIGKLGTTGGGAGRSSPLRWNGGRETQSDVGHGSGIGSEGGGLLERFQSVRKGR
jgi:dedicator of cytokinesis protein 3